MTDHEAVLRIALAGQPNVGKSTVFNALTGLNQHVGNWPGKTVESKEGTTLFQGRRIEIVDLPGAYGLTASSEEERIARDYIIKNKPDVVILVANAAALDRNLYLLAEMLALPVSVTLGLNMMDVATSEGVDIMPVVLEANLGLPVIPVTAITNAGVSGLISVAVAEADERARFHPARPELGAGLQRSVNRLRKQIEKHVPRPYEAEWIASKLLEGDSEIIALARQWLPERDWRQVESFLTENEDAALDLSQETWVKAWQRLQQFQGDSSFSTWATRIAINVCLDQLRKNKRQQTESIEMLAEEAGGVERQILRVRLPATGNRARRGEPGREFAT